MFALLLLLDVSTGSTANFRGADLGGCASSLAGVRLDFVDVSTGTGANRLGEASAGMMTGKRP